MKTKAIAHFSRAALIALVMAVFVPSASAVAAGPGSAERVVRDYYAVLTQVMRSAKSLGFDGRYKTLSPVVERTFDLKLIARVAVGRHWSKLGTRQRGDLVRAFARLSVATYASRFKDYTGEKFMVLGSVDTRRKDKLVKTQIVTGKGKKIPINYLLRKRQDGWRVIDVYLNGTISEVATRRADFGSVLRRGGYDGLMRAIDSKVRKLRSN